jgi:hypothetical protein
LAFDASKSEKLGKEVEATPRQNVGKNFLAKRNQDRKIRDLAAAREKGRTASDEGCAYGLTKRAIKIPFGSSEHKEKRAIMGFPAPPRPPRSLSRPNSNLGTSFSGEIKKNAPFFKCPGGLLKKRSILASL